MTLSKAEQLALEEYKLVLESYHKSEEMYTRWDNLFILAETIMLAGISQLIVQGQVVEIQIITSLICIGGVVLSLLWFLVLSKSYLYSLKRVERLKEIEKFLRIRAKKTITDKEKEFLLFNFVNYIRKVTDPKYNKKIPIHQRFSAWKCRIAIPIVFSVIWFVFLVLSLRGISTIISN